MTERRLRGIDVSTYQGIITDAIAEALVAAGCTFAYVRAAVGTGAKPDDRLMANIAVFKRHGIACGPYFFPYPLPGKDPRAQAELHMKIAEGLGTSVGELAPMIDAEWPPPATRLADGTLENTWAKFGCSKDQIRAWLEGYGERLDELSGCNCPYYTYTYFDASIEAWRSVSICKRPLVLANYKFTGIIPTDVQITTIAPLRGRDKITILQHDGDGGLRLPGSSADVDWNVMADPDDLARLTGQPKPPATLDYGLPDLAAVGHVESADHILEDEIADYRRSRIDDAA